MFAGLLLSPALMPFEGAALEQPDMDAGDGFGDGFDFGGFDF